MKKFALVGILSAFAVLGIVSILMPARAASDGLPVGTIIAWGGTSSSVPSDWMLCNGKALSKSAYPELLAAIGTSWGSRGAKFNLPDLRGRFLRGEDAGTGRDPDVNKRTPSNPGGSASGVGSVQEDMAQDHTHTQTPHSHNYTSWPTMVQVNDGSAKWVIYASGAIQASSSSSEAVIMGARTYRTKSQIKAGEESRPKNAAVNFIIKVK